MERHLPNVLGQAVWPIGLCFFWRLQPLASFSYHLSYLSHCSFVVLLILSSSVQHDAVVLSLSMCSDSGLSLRSNSVTMGLIGNSYVRFHVFLLEVDQADFSRSSWKRKSLSILTEKQSPPFTERTTLSLSFHQISLLHLLRKRKFMFLKNTQYQK